MSAMIRPARLLSNGSVITMTWQVGDDGRAWGSDVRRDVFIVVDEQALESLLTDDPDTAWATVFDAQYSSHDGRPEYPGWMRCRAWALVELWKDLDAVDEGMSELCPPRHHSGQILLYGGGPGDTLLEIESPLRDGMMHYPRGTCRGVMEGTQRGAIGATMPGSNGEHPETVSR
ncbi:hypothetical protein PFICI_10142 [Pestalotiopsis fici W106-1]|uniref:Uncharacterized protein n=1 Tax=Pestalotiopsis fici (strain W106-1 / CGMCC3.15140) TaxID=1229662 RepID=W3WW48_PESFW|nr:uncharacterized protein PFICI_10142 [Pestalotiopsis fici W106-1]ETS78080.1 hypothetical protein PFICI_10142 [Pestalotiopsis fici W106-1]